MKQAISLLLSLILGVGLRTVADVPPAMLEAAEIQLKMEAMTLEEKVGQLFLPRCPGGDDTPALTQRLQPAGYTLYASDFAAKSPDQVRTQLAGYQAEAKIPLLLAVDEEGGSVVRVSSNPQLAAAPFDSPQNVYAQGGLGALTQDTQNKCALLLDLGINLNLAPVCDISTNPSDYIYPRTMGLPPEETALAIAETVRTMEAQGLSSTLKHFPGYGSNFDTHTGISIDDRPYETLQNQDFKPFQAGIQAGAPSILVSHNIMASIDPQRPASLSPPVHSILRGELGFQGVIMTDDLSMDAIKLYTNGQSPAVQAVLAGNDLLLTSDWERDFQAVLSAVQDGTISTEALDSAVGRILKWKKAKGLL